MSASLPGGIRNVTATSYSDSVDEEPLPPTLQGRPLPRATKIRYPVAHLDGSLVWANELATGDERPTELRCVGCGGALTLRAGSNRRPHFAHRSSDPCAGGESALHRVTIQVIADALQEAAQHGRAYPVVLACFDCDASRPGDLAKTTAMMVERDRVVSNGIRPDLLIRDGNGEPRVVIEVVVTHAPEETALAEFTSLGLTAIVVYPTWETLEAMREGLAHLSSDSRQPAHIELLGRCPFGRHLTEADGELRPCSQCHAPARVLTVEVSETPCWAASCSKRVRILDLYAHLDGQRVLVAAGAGDLRGVESVAAAAGVRLQRRYSKMAMTTYLMNVCECGAPSGDNFVYGGLGGETCSPSLTDPVRRYEVCESGHWTPVETCAWHPATRAGRSEYPVGLVGERANLFDHDYEESLVKITQFEDPRKLARFMTRGFR